MRKCNHCASPIRNLMMRNFLKNIFRKRKLTNDNENIVLMPTDDDNWTNIQIDSWKVKLNNPASNEVITHTQNKLNYEFPNDFINFTKNIMVLPNGIL